VGKVVLSPVSTSPIGFCPVFLVAGAGVLSLGGLSPSWWFFVASLIWLGLVAARHRLPSRGQYLAILEVVGVWALIVLGIFALPTTIPSPTNFYLTAIATVILAIFGIVLWRSKEEALTPPPTNPEVATLKKALADELTVIANRMRSPPPPADLPNALTHDYGRIDIPVYSSVLNSGKIFLLDDILVRALNDLNQNIQTLNSANEDLRTGFRSLTTMDARSHLGELNRIMLNPDLPTEDPLVSFLKVAILQTRIIKSKVPAILVELGEPLKVVEVEQSAPPQPPPSQSMTEAITGATVEYQSQAVSQLLAHWLDSTHKREISLTDLGKMLPRPSLRDRWNPLFEPLTLADVGEGIDELLKKGTIRKIENDVIYF
jgi:hypothetical protein